MDASVLESLPPNIDRRRSYLILIWTLLAFAAVFVFPRMYVRTRVTKVAGWDDYLISCALLVQVINNVCGTLAVENGALIHIFYLTDSQLSNVIKWVKMSQLCSIVAPILVKFSICISILRMVTIVQRPITITIWILMTVLSLTGLATFLVEVMQCLPLKKLWQPGVAGRCLGVEVSMWVLIAYGIVCVMTDFICGILPIIVLRGLQKNRITRYALSFLLGLVFVPCICSIFRTMETRSIDNPDITWAVSGPATWSSLETNTGLIIACLPMLWSPALTASKKTVSYLSLWRLEFGIWKASRSSQLPLESVEYAQSSQSTRARRNRSGLQQQQRPEESFVPASPHHTDSEEDPAPPRDGDSGSVYRKGLNIIASQRLDLDDPEAPSLYR